MIIITCTHCRSAIEVTGDPHEISCLLGEHSDFWPDHYLCFRCGEPAEYSLLAEVSSLALATLNIVRLTAQEAFAALNGLGLPEERTCCSEVVLPYFEQVGIKVKGNQPRGQTFFRVEELTFPDGTTMFLAPSPMGAVIYRVRKKHSYTGSI